MTENGHVRMSNFAVSMPYGAAALTKRLSEAEKNGTTKALRTEVCRDLKNAFQKIELPQELRGVAAISSGLSLYLSGGGFRGWGYLLLHKHSASPYPIPIINGFHCKISHFQDVETVKATVLDSDVSVFRISKRRASQVPAVAFLISCLSEALPAVHSVHFAQGGVREGVLFSMLDPSIRAHHPLVVGTRPGCPPSSAALTELLRSALPPSNDHAVPEHVRGPVLESFVHSLYAGAGLVKDLRAASALRSTTTGAYASIHGLSHHDRAALAITLCERWDGVGALSSADQDFHTQLVQLLDPEQAWWCMFLGRVGAVVAEVYPSGTVRGNLAALGGEWIDDKDDKSSRVLRLEVKLSIEAMELSEAEGLQKAIKELEKVGKKKNRPSGHGYKVDVKLRSMGG